MYKFYRLKLHLGRAMKTFTFTLFFIIYYLYSFGQRPMSKELIISKLDSLLNESNLLIDLSLKNKKLSEFMELNHQLSIMDMEIVNYYLSDTLISTVLSENKSVARFYHQNDTFLYLINKSNEELMIEIENYHIRTKKLLLEKSLKNTEALLPNGFFYETYYLGMPFGSRLYQLSSTNSKDIIPFGGDFLYIIKENQGVEQIKFSEFHPSDISSRPDKFILVYKDNTKYILPSDIYKFRRYNTMKNSDSFFALSRRNKTFFEYKEKTNEIKIKDPFE